MLVLRLIQEGGPVMWIILVCSLLSLFVFLEKTFQFHREEINVRELLRGLFNVLKREGLVEAILADCALGLMGQNWEFRPNPDVSTTYWLDFDMGNQMDNLTIYSDCINTNTWLTEHGFISSTLEELGGVTGHYKTK